MPDPLSTTASVFAVIGFAAGLSGVLYRFVSSIRDAPKEISHLTAELEALSGTFASIEAISRDLPSRNALSVEFLGRLRSCMAEFEDLERSVRKLERYLKQNPVMAKVRWPYGEPSAVQFSRRLRSYHVTFSLALTALQM